MKNKYLFLLIVMLGLNANSQTLDALFKPLKFRNIGPFRGGRSNSATGVIGDPLTYYMGTTGGGVWKTTDAGQQWKNISDGYFKTGSVGAVTVSESHPNVVYVGMGEHAPRGVMTSYGDGVYKSTDAGKTWKHIGLKETRHISRIIVAPDNPDVLWVAAQGALHGPNKERGIYKSIDGGKTWKNVLFVNELTGAADLSIDTHNPQVLYVAMWEHQRLPWQVVSGGPGSGLYKSIDGGENWFKIHKGLPEEKGKMAIAVSKANPEIVYALIESDSEKEKGGLFLSKNAGKSWSKISGDHRLIQRAWYYIEVFPDPNDENTVYVLSASPYRSIDGGKTWERIRTNHGDYHDLWINPNNSKNMVIADDGGAEITFDSGQTWSRIDHMPTAQFYRVAVDNLTPYNVYGGQQDNTSVKIASKAEGGRSIGRQHWSASAGGESAFLAFDPDQPTKVLGGSYLGTIEVLDTETNAGTKIMIEPNLYLGLEARKMKYLFNWNAPIIRSQYEENTFYHGAQYVLRTKDFGTSWDVISPDLTRNDDSKQGNGGGPYTNEAVGAENYGTLSYIVESPLEKGVIYTGSDDGLVYITKNNGESWENITPKGLQETLINAIEVSPHDPATVYIATTRYKFNDHTPALYKSTNYGKSWQNISSGIPVGAYTRVVREDPVRKNLLIAGTETGFYISWNGGKKWQLMQLNLPIVPLTDIVIKHDDIIVATQGRSFWILDDINVLRETNGTASPGKIYTPEAVVLGSWSSPMNAQGESPKGTAPFEGVNPANGVVIYYELPELDKKTAVKVEIQDASGNTVRQYHSETDKTYVSFEGAPPKKTVASKKKGMNRLVWDLRYPLLEATPKVYIEGSFRGHKAIPGNYTISVSYGKEKHTTSVAILPNPKYPTTQAEYEEYHTFMSTGEATYNEMTRLTNKLFIAQQSLETLLPKIDAKKYPQTLINAKSTLEKVKAWDGIMVQRLAQAYDDVENFVNGFTAEYITVINQTESAIPKVNNGSKEKMAELNQQWESHKKEAEELQKELTKLNQLLFESGFGSVPF